MPTGKDFGKPTSFNNGTQKWNGAVGRILDGVGYTFT